MRNRGESAAEAGRENLYIINGLQKTSPLNRASGFLMAAEGL